MTASINTQNKPPMVEQTKPVLKAADHPSKDKEEQNTVRSIESSKIEKTEDKTDISKVNQAEETTKEKQVSEQDLDTAVKQLNTYVQSINRNLQFNIDKDNGQTVVKVMDSETDELIRQIPNEETLRIARHLNEGLGENNSDAGLLLIKERA